MARAHLTAVIGADTRGFSQGLNKLRPTIKGMGKAMLAIGAAASAALLKATRDAINYGDAIDKAAKRTGIGAEQLQRYQLAAELSGGSVQDLEKATKRSASVILDAQNGLAESVRALDVLGLSADDLAKKTPEQQLDAFLTALAGVENHSKRAALAQDIFGRAGTNLLPIIDGGVDAYKSLLNEADNLNAVLSQQQVTAAAEAKDAITRLGASIKGLAFGAILSDGMSVADMFNTMAQRVAEFNESGGMQTLTDTFQSLGQILGFVAKSLAWIFEQIGKAGKLGEDIIGAVGLTSTGQQFGRLGRGSGEFGAANKDELAIFRYMMENGIPVYSKDGSV